MLAAHMPTATSRCGLDRMMKSSSSRNLLGTVKKNGSGSLRQRKKKTAKENAEEEEKKEQQQNPEEARAYAAVSLLYALGQSLYDIFSSQQAKSTTLRFQNAYLAAYAYAILVSAYPMAKALSSPYVGHLSDRLGRKSVLVATLVATGFCLGCCGSAESYWGVLVARFATGCVANGGLLTARATDVAADHAQRTRLFSLFTTAWAVARVGAALLVRVLTLDVARACKFAAWCEISAAGIALLAFRRVAASPSKKQNRSERTQVKMRPSFRALAREMLSERLALCLFATSMLTPRVDATAFVSRRFGDAGLAESVAYLKAVEAVAVVAVGLTPFSKRLGKRCGDAGVAVIAGLAVALGWIGVACAPNLLALYFLVAVRAACAAVYDPAARSLVWARAADRKDKTPGSVAGLQQSLKGATQVFSSWLGAYLTTLSVSAPLAISAVAMIANALSVAFIEKRHPVVTSSSMPEKASPSEKKPAVPVVVEKKKIPAVLEEVEEEEHFSEEECFVGGNKKIAAYPKRKKNAPVSPVPEEETEEDDASFEEIDEDQSQQAWREKEGLKTTVRRNSSQEEVSSQLKQGKLLRLVCCCECATENAWSVDQVSTWLRNRGQGQAAELAAKNGVDGTALAIAQSAEELREAFDNKVSTLVCRAILCAFQKQEISSIGLKDAPLSATGRARAMALRRTSTHSPDLIVAAPDRGCIQTALLAFRNSHPDPSLGLKSGRRRIVAHDSLATKISQEIIESLQLEYGAAVDLSLIDVEISGTNDLQSRVFALLAFLRARPESNLALVATTPILDGLQTALTSGGFDLAPHADSSTHLSDSCSPHLNSTPEATTNDVTLKQSIHPPDSIDQAHPNPPAWTPLRPGTLRDIYLHNSNTSLAIPRAISLTHSSSADDDGPESW